MRKVEVEGSSRVDATEKALKLLNADIDDVKVEVLKEERSGILGFLGFKKVTVRVSLVEENVVEIAAGIINSISAYVPVPFDAEVELKKNVVYIRLTGDEIKKFQKREDFAGSLEHIVELMLNKQMKRSIRVRAAFADDERNRQRKLEELARKNANKVVSQNKPVSLQPMTGWERRVVHMTLEKDDRVFTESSGKKRGRHVVIYPMGYEIKKKGKGDGGKSGKKERRGEGRKRRRPDKRSGRKPDPKRGASKKGGGRGGGKGNGETGKNE
ncbi:MAG: hypothetical protein GY771_12335 [bacterium]|nr:hypothetical protein [bacterium]